MQFDSDQFDIDVFGEGREYQIDMQLATTKSLTYSLDTILGYLMPYRYQVATSIVNEHLPAKYSVDVVLVRSKESEIFKESIINAIMISCGRACEALSTEILNSESRMKLLYATSEDLDLYWSKMLSIRRKYKESDEDFRRRLSARLLIMKSSGTVGEIRELIDTMLNMENAAEIKSYWPCEMRINWRTYDAMREAEKIYPELKEALDLMSMAGVQWSTSFPYKNYLVDLSIASQASKNYETDTKIEIGKYKIYPVALDIFERGSLNYDLAISLELTHSVSQNIAVTIEKQKSKAQKYAIELLGPIEKNYDLGVRVAKITRKEYSLGIMISKAKILPYAVDMQSMREKRYPYLLSLAVEE